MTGGPGTNRSRGPTTQPVRPEKDRPTVPAAPAIQIGLCQLVAGGEDPDFTDIQKTQVCRVPDDIAGIGDAIGFHLVSHLDIRLGNIAPV